jgi:hypothetical protein
MLLESRRGRHHYAFRRRNANYIDIDINLASPNNTGFTRLFLNYGGPPLPAGYGFSASNVSGVAFGPDSKGTANYGMDLDLQLSETSSRSESDPYRIEPDKAVEPRHQPGPAYFNYKDTNNSLLYALVNYSGTGQPVGALVATVIPEPGSIALLAIGFATLVAMRKRAARA